MVDAFLVNTPGSYPKRSRKLAHYLSLVLWAAEIRVIVPRGE